MKPRMKLKHPIVGLIVVIALFIAGCEAGVSQLLPTSRPTLTATLTQTGLPTQDPSFVPTQANTDTPSAPTAGPTPTSLFGPTSVPIVANQTATRSANAPRIEFFRADSTVVEPGGSVTLFWSIRGVSNAVIYQLDNRGERSLVYNIPPDGSETITTRSRDRGQINFLLVVGEGANQVEQQISVGLACPIEWFFEPSPEACPNDEAEETSITLQNFERGRMIYVESTDTVYALMNDLRSPAWIAIANRYDPAIHPAFDESFERALVGTGFYQPRGRLGFVWRGNDAIRNRLGNAIEEAVTFTGSIQTAPDPLSGENNIFLSSNDGTIIELLPGGDLWQIITPF